MYCVVWVALNESWGVPNIRFDKRQREEILNAQPSGRQVYADGFAYQGEPILLTEFGGLAYEKDKGKGWGYTTIENEEDFLKNYKRILRAIGDSQVIYGFCYTQLYDVQQEVNGLLTYDQKYKISPDKIKKINAFPSK